MNDSKTPCHRTGFEIAIIGMAGRFPGASNIEAFWENLQGGVESISFFSDEELLASGVDPSELRDPNYVKARGILEGADEFDAAFFGYTPREAELIDPQQRLFLESAWEAVENAGYDAERCRGSVAVYAGIGMNTYLMKNLLSNVDLLESAGDYSVRIGNDKDFLTTRVSYKLNLEGPGVVVQTACSTSLVAVHLACQSLLSGECDIALGGGVSLRLPLASGYFYEQEGIHSPDGHCRAFSAQAQGTVGGSGVAIVVLKRLEDALADGDCIHAVIKGSAINNDGSLKAGFTAPRVDGQAGAITRALAMAEVDPESISYVEAHGTGTALGDPIEVAALTQAFRTGTQKKNFCAIGSVKTNIGHLDVAAGVAGLIKTVLALEHKELPASLHCEELNPTIDFTNSPFFVNTKQGQWQTDGIARRAGVSSFGLGGTNAHAVLEEAPPCEPSGPSRPWQALVLSAKTSTALETATTNLVDHLKRHPDLVFADVAYTLQLGRKAFGHRRLLVCRDLEDAVSTLESGDSKRVMTDFVESGDRPVTFMFPGQGSQYVNMGLELYQTEPTFREHVDHCCELLKPYLGMDLRDLLYAKQTEAESAAQQLEQTRFAQPALFVIGYALAQLWMAWGVRPQAMIGHSVGEYVAACLAGVFSLEDALKLVTARARLIQELPGGAMLAVPLPQSEVQPLVGDSLSLAAINGPSLCAVSGPTDAVEYLEKQLAEKEVACRRLHTSHAFHSEMMDPVLAPFTELVSKIERRPPQIPFVSNVSGSWITAAEATDPGYWVRHLRQTVRFSEGVQELLKESKTVLLEVGPGNTLGRLAAGHPTPGDKPQIVSTTRHPENRQSDVVFLLNTLGRLWLSGVPVDWSAYYAHERRQRVPIPTYPFERQRYWVEPQETTQATVARSPSLEKKADIADWFYVPSWKRTPPVTRFETMAQTHRQSCRVVFADTYGLGSQIGKHLEAQGLDVITVNPGQKFARLDDGQYVLNPRSREDYDFLIKELHSRQKTPEKILHLWGVTSNESIKQSPNDSEFALQDLGFYSLFFLAQALGEKYVTEGLHFAVVTNNVQEVTGEESLSTEKATVLGLCQAIPLHYHNFTCRSVDIVLPETGNGRQAEVDRLIAEFDAKDTETVVAYRGAHRWVQTFEPIRLDDHERPPARLRKSGVYLITGGLGGIGLVLAEYLARTVQAKLVLTGRTGLPRKDTWDQWLATHDETDDTSRKIRKVQALEKLDADVLVMSADVTRAEQMQEVIKRASFRFGKIDGVIHSAGTVPAGLIQTRTRETAEVVLAPKVKGTQVLDELFEDQKLDFLVLCSSLASVLGSFISAEYCAANVFLDAFAHAHNGRQGPFTVSINWDRWSEVGMAVNTEQEPDVEAVLQETLRKGIRSNEGMDAFGRILRSGLPQVLVSTRDLSARLNGQDTMRPSSAELDVSEEASASTTSSHTRPDLMVEYAAPQTKFEKELADIWQRLFGIEQVGIHDDFFELGGHSLLGTQLLNKLNQKYEKAKLSLTILFDNPTIAGLAQLIEKAYGDQTETDDEPFKAQLLHTTPAERHGLLEAYLREQIAQALGPDGGQLPPDGSLAELDIESIAPHLIWSLKRDFQLPVYLHELRNQPSIGVLAEWVNAEMERMSTLKRAAANAQVILPELKGVQRLEVKRLSLPPSEKNESMIFLLSAARSGSTLLRVMLAGHSGLFCPPELALLRFDTLSEWNQDQRLRFARTGLEVAFMSLMDLDADAGKVFMDDLTQQDMSIQEVYRNLQQRAETRTLVDKTPRYAMDLETLEKAEALFREPKYVHLVRHPYSVIDSFVRNRIDKLLEEEGDAYAIAEKHWAVCNSNILEFRGGLNPERYHRICYENLVREPRKVMGDLCEFLSIPFEEAVLQPYEGPRMIAGPGDPDVFQHDGIDARLGEVWKTITLPRPLCEFSRHLADELNVDLPKEEAVDIKRDETADPAAIGMGRNDSPEGPPRVDQLSDAEVDDLLSKMLADEESDR